jgi:hypothetical protein
MSDKKVEQSGMPTETEVLEAVRKSGYLMDQEVATVLEGLGFHVQPSWPFEDPDEGESRELDVWAIQRVLAEGELHLFVELFCECKSGEDRPFVFITRAKGQIDQSVCPIHYVFPHDTYEEPIPNGSRVVKAFSHFDLSHQHYWFTSDSKAVQFAKTVRNTNQWEAQHDGLYNAILMPLVKALTYRAKSLRSNSNPLHLCFPIVVLKSPIYVINSAKEPLELMSVAHVSFFRRLDSRSVKGEYIVDFVTLDGLTGLVNTNVLPFSEQVAALAQTDPRQFIVKRGGR